MVIGDKRVDLDDIIANSEQALFVKGIQAGSFAVRNRERGSPFSIARYTTWLRPTFLLNVRRPSYLEFNLDRSSAWPKSKDWIEAVWREIASKLRTNAFNWPIQSPGDLALLLGACAIFGAVPDYGLDSLVAANDCPLLVLRAGKGPIWVPLREFAHGEEFIEAPFELAYANYHRDYLKIGHSTCLDGWEGDDALFPLDKIESEPYPWLKAVLVFSRRALAQSGWSPVAICLVRPPDKETVPLVCRVWRKSDGVYANYAWSDEEPTERDRTKVIGNSLKRLYSEAPEVLKFPGSMAQYAAFGSRYWNADHAKIAGILSVLTELMDYRSLHRLSADGERMVSHLTSSTFYGYVVPARFARVDLALEVPNRLL